jgi:hypothetical protein
LKRRRRPLFSGAVSINIGTKLIRLTCWSASLAAQQRRPTTLMCQCRFESPQAIFSHTVFKYAGPARLTGKSGGCGT